VVAELPSTAERVVEVHTFDRAWDARRPGRDRRAAAIVLPCGGDAITLLNPGSWRSQPKPMSRTTAAVEVVHNG
jgi:hypothetical protein